jgi:GxxExxY protein
MNQSSDAFDDVDEPDPELNRISNAIIGAAIEVHRLLGPGYQESVYENALAIEFTHRGIRYVRQHPFQVFYKGEMVGEGRLDFLVEDKVVVDLKAVIELHPLFTSQIISYLRATHRKLGIILNFNVRKLTDGIKRIAS